jgi:HAE1 family hydrophobic/amphiphilic exporter-1
MCCLSLLLSAAGAAAPARSLQQDPRQPPGAGQRTPPADARPQPRVPSAPPGARTDLPAPTPAPIIASPTPAIESTTNPQTQNPQMPSPSPSPEDEEIDPALLVPTARELPPMPSLNRLGVDGTQTLTLSLDEAIRMALKNNNSIEVARHDVRYSENILRSLEGAYDYQFTLSPRYNKSVSPSFSTLSGADSSGTVSQTDLQVDSSAGKLMRRGGGRYEIFYNNLRSNSSSSFSQFNPFYSTSLGVSFTQPLLRDRKIDNTRREIRIQRKLIQQSDADFRRLTTNVIAQVQSAYYELVFALRNLQNRVTNLKLARENFYETEARIEAGTSAPIERSEVQTSLSNREAEVLFASRNVSAAENVLKELILRDPLAREWSTTILPTDQLSFEPTPVDLATVMNEARANRPELQRLQFQSDINDINYNYLKNQAKPRVDLQATVATTGLAGSAVNFGSPSTTPIPLISGNPTLDPNAFLLREVNQLRAAQGLGPAVVPTLTQQDGGSSVPPGLVGGYGRLLRNLLSFQTKNVVVGVTIQLPLRNQTAKANLEGQRIVQSQLAASVRLTGQAVEREVRDAAQAVETSRQAVLAARVAREGAEWQLRGERSLYQVGRSTTFLLLQRQNQLVEARNSELRAEIDYGKALVELQRATSSTLRVNNVLITDLAEK